MKHALIAAALLATVSTASYAAPNDPLASAAGFLKQCESTRKGTVEDTECITYAAGIFSGIAAAQKNFAPRLAGNAGETEKLDAATLNNKYGAVCGAPALSPRDLRDKLVKHLRKNSGGTTADAFMRALESAYPCKGE